MSRIEIDRLVPDKGDVGKTFIWRNDIELMKFFRQSLPLSVEEHAHWFKRIETDKSIEMFAIRVSSNYELIGVCGLTSIDHVNSRAEFSLYIAPECQKNGLGKEALTALFEIAFNVLNLHLVWGESFKYNPAREFFKKMGMTEDGCRRNFYYKNGEYIDAYLYSITKDEWRGTSFPRGIHDN